MGPVLSFIFFFFVIVFVFVFSLLATTQIKEAAWSKRRAAFFCTSLAQLLCLINNLVIDRKYVPVRVIIVEVSNSVRPLLVQDLQILENLYF